jgi:predicted nucleic acid-binding protein
MPTVSNTSPISNLAAIARLGLLEEQFHEVWIPEAVERELARLPDDTIRRTVNDALGLGWLKVGAVTNGALVSLLNVDLHAGEAEAIALGLERGAQRVLIDERDGRVFARQLGLHVTGVLGVLLRAKRTGRLPAIKPEIDAPVPKLISSWLPLLSRRSWPALESRSDHSCSGRVWRAANAPRSSR